LSFGKLLQICVQFTQNKHRNGKKYYFSNFYLIIKLFRLGSISPTCLPYFFHDNKLRRFLANGVWQTWQTANRFGKQRLNLANFTLPHMGKVLSRMLVKLNVNFFSKRFAPATFCLANKVW